MENEGKGARFVYYSLITTFIALYLCVAFVSTLHAITFFQLANNLTLAIFLGVAFEIGQSSVLFGILTTRNKHQIMAWSMMFLLTAVQITANVFASFKFMDQSGNQDWVYWQRSILFWLEADTPEIYKVTIAWITGALLPIVALGLTSLASDNIKLSHEKVSLDYDEEDYDEYKDYGENDEEGDDADDDADDNYPEANDSLKAAAKKYNAVYGKKENINPPTQPLESEEIKLADKVIEKVKEKFEGQDAEDLDFIEKVVKDKDSDTKVPHPDDASAGKKA